MGQNSQELKKEIEDTRDLLEDRVTELAGKFRATAESAKATGKKAAVVAGVVVCIVLISKLLRRRRSNS